MNQNQTNSIYYKQKRLRHITSLNAKNLQINSNRFSVWFTMHSSVNSTAFYISEKKENDRNPKWNTKNLNKFTHKQFIIRFWYSNADICFVNSTPSKSRLNLLLEIDVDLDYLEWLGDLNLNYTNKFFNNFLIFEIFNTKFCEPLPTDDIKRDKMSRNGLSSKSDLMTTKKSYDLNLMKRVCNYTRVIRENQKNALNFKNNTLSKFETLARFKQLEMAREEKQRKIEYHKFNLQKLNESIYNLKEQNNRLSQMILVYKKNLDIIQKKRDDDNEKLIMLQTRIESKLRIHLQIETQLNNRQRQLVTDLSEIFQISRYLSHNKSSMRILSVSPEGTNETNELIDKEISVALGYIVQAVLMLVFILGVPLRYPLIFKSSKSFVIEFFEDSHVRKHALFKQNTSIDINFALGVQLLELNVLQLRFLYDKTKSFVSNDLLTNLKWIFDHLKV